jgi:hypothetical protein
MPYCDGGELFDAVALQRRFTEAQVMAHCESCMRVLSPSYVYHSVYNSYYREYMHMYCTREYINFCVGVLLLKYCCLVYKAASICKHLLTSHTRYACVYVC